LTIMTRPIGKAEDEHTSSVTSNTMPARGVRVPGRLTDLAFQSAMQLV